MSNPALNELMRAIVSNSLAWTLRAVGAVGPDAKNENGEPMLWRAALDGKFNAVTALLAVGAGADARGGGGLTPLMAAMSVGDPQARKKIAMALLSAGADPRASVPKGETVAMFAARSGAVECLRELGRAGADLSATTDAGASAATIAAGGEHWEALAYLATQGALGGVSREGVGVEAIVRERIARGADIDSQDWAPLERAWLEGQTSKAARSAPPRL